MAHVLIVDDDPAQAAFYTTLLTNRGLTPQLTSDRGEALLAISHRIPDAVLLDLGLPHGEAVTLIRDIRSLPECHDVKVFVLANAFLELEALAAWEAGADQVVGKSNYPPEQVLEFLIAEVGGGAGGARTAQPTTADPALFEFLERAAGYAKECRAAVAQMHAGGEVPPALDVLATSMRRLQAAQAFGLPSIPQLAAVAEWLTRALIAWPSSLSASALRTIGQSLDLIERQIENPSHPGRDLSQCRVLGVDDDATSRLLLQQAFRKIHVETDVVADGQSALALAGRRRYDLLVTDVVMPGMDGPELATRAHTLPGWAPVPTLFVATLEDIDRGDTAYGSGDDTRSSTREARPGVLPADADTIVKPYLIMELATKAVVHLLRTPEALPAVTDVQGGSSKLP
ncbi:MAG: response regulator [Planctomycetes bacterium]|nr:response regulator [Planctomycetota bacterium]